MVLPGQALSPGTNLALPCSYESLLNLLRRAAPAGLAVVLSLFGRVCAQTWSERLQRDPVDLVPEEVPR
jgi:hypothetical protein